MGGGEGVQEVVDQFSTFLGIERRIVGKRQNIIISRGAIDFHRMVCETERRLLSKKEGSDTGRRSGRRKTRFVVIARVPTSLGVQPVTRRRRGLPTELPILTNRKLKSGRPLTDKVGQQCLLDTKNTGEDRKETKKKGGRKR